MPLVVPEVLKQPIDLFTAPVTYMKVKGHRQSHLCVAVQGGLSIPSMINVPTVRNKWKQTLRFLKFKLPFVSALRYPNPVGLSSVFSLHQFKSGVDDCLGKRKNIFVWFYCGMQLSHQNTSKSHLQDKRLAFFLYT